MHQSDYIEGDGGKWYYGLTDTDKAYLIAFVEEVLVTCKNDFDGVTSGLDDMALNAGVILGLSKAYMESLD